MTLDNTAAKTTKLDKKPKPKPQSKPATSPKVKSKTGNSLIKKAKGFVLALRSGKRSIPIFKSSKAYSIMSFGLGFMVLAGFAGFIAANLEFASGVLKLGRTLLFWGFIFTLVFSLFCAAYLTLTKNWDHYLTWRVMRKAYRRDRRASVTTDPMILIEGLHCPQGQGLIFGMHKATKYPKRDVTKLTYDDDRHAVMIAGSRAGKGTSYIIPNMIHHKGSVIINDPSGENFDLTAAYRQQVLGQKIILLDPLGVTGKHSHRWNPMAEIDFDSDPFAIDKCYMLAESVLAQKSSDPYWTQAGRKLLAMVIAYVGNRSIAQHNHLGTVRDLLLSSDLGGLWMAMSECENYGGIIRRFGEANLSREEKELASVLETVRTALKFMDSDVMTQFLTASDFVLSDLKSKNITVYIVLPAGTGETYAPWTRLLFNAAFKGAQDLTIPKPQYPILFIMDEFALLGRMERIKQAAGEAAKFGVKLFIIVQDISQLKEHYGVAWETFIANSGILIMFSNNDLATQNYLSERLGKHKVKKMSFTSSDSGSSTTTSWETEAVSRPDQAEKQTSRQSGDAYIFIAGAKPCRLPRAPYYIWNMIPKGLVYRPTTTDNIIAQAAE